MENQLYSLSKIFTERILRIPDYQRGYAWTEKQIKDFWSDLIQLEEGKNHYTGVLTLEDVPDSAVTTWEEDLWIIRSKRYYPHYVVDGQQRLTTAIILIQCITQITPEDQKLNYTEVKDIRKKFIFDSKDDGISRSYIFGYEKDNPSYEFLKRRIFLEGSDTSLPIQETIYTQNLENAKAFFLNKLGELDFARIEQLYGTLTQNFHFNLYSISSDIDVYVAFETMNNRGKPLSHLELLKNRLIYLTTKFDDADYERQRLRTAVNESWKSIYHYLGKNKDNPLDDDVFLVNHFNIFHSEIIEEIQKNYQVNYGYRLGRRQKTYQEYLLEARFTARNISEKSLTLSQVYEYVQSMKHAVEIWYQILNPADSNFSPEEKLWLEKLNKLRITDITSLLLVVFLIENDTKNRVRLLKSIERYLFVHTFPATSYQYALLNTGYTGGFPQLARDLQKGSLTTEKIARDLDQAVDVIFTNRSFLAQFLTSFKGKAFYEWRGIKYFLYEYELELKAKSKTYRDKLNWKEFSAEDNRDFYTVEHIYPQKAHKHCWAGKFNKYTEKERNLLKHSLGNLVPLSQPKNSSFQNKCFIDKLGDSETQIGFRYGSYSENEIAAKDDWTAREILERGLKLISFMEKRWRLSFGDNRDKMKLLNLEFVTRKEGIKSS